MNFSKIDWKGWFLLVVGVGITQWMIYSATAKAYPGLLDLTLGSIAIVAGFCTYQTWNANEPDENVRRAGLIGKILVTATSVLILWGHVSLAREIESSEQAEAEYGRLSKVDSEAAGEFNRQQIELIRAQTDQALAEARREQAQANKYAQLPPSERRGLAKPGGPKAGQTPTAEIKSEGPKVEKRAFKTAALVREEWRPFMMKTLFLELIFALGGNLLVTLARHWDRKGIKGVPDWIERVWFQGGQAGQDYIQQSFGQYVPMLTNPNAPTWQGAPLGNV